MPVFLFRRGYGLASYEIHLKQCKAMWEAKQQGLPACERMCLLTRFSYLVVAYLASVPSCAAAARHELVNLPSLVRPGGGLGTRKVPKMV